MMRHALTFLAGIAFGTLLMLVLNLPLIGPLDTNTAQVVAALSSTALAVIGAFALWGYQSRSRQSDLQAVLVPIFDPLYAALAQVRDLSSKESASKLLFAVRQGLSDEAVEPSESEVLDYQEAAFPRAIAAAIVEAKNVVAHWSGMSDLLTGISPKRLPQMLAMHRIASGALAQLPDFETRARPTYMEQRGPQVGVADAALLGWAVGKLAQSLNEIDGGRRDESGCTAMEPGRLAAINTWAASGVK